MKQQHGEDARGAAAFDLDLRVDQVALPAMRVSLAKKKSESRAIKQKSERLSIQLPNCIASVKATR
jgi:hypothetical protein